jgi:hypothetical protein
LNHRSGHREPVVEVREQERPESLGFRQGARLQDGLPQDFQLAL